MLKANTPYDCLQSTIELKAPVVFSEWLDPDLWRTIGEQYPLVKDFIEHLADRATFDTDKEPAQNESRPGHGYQEQLSDGDKQLLIEIHETMLACEDNARARQLSTNHRPHEPDRNFQYLSTMYVAGTPIGIGVGMNPGDELSHPVAHFIDEGLLKLVNFAPYDAKQRGIKKWALEERTRFCLWAMATVKGFKDGSIKAPIAVSPTVEAATRRSYGLPPKGAKRHENANNEINARTQPQGIASHEGNTLTISISKEELVKLASAMAETLYDSLGTGGATECASVTPMIVEKRQDGTATIKLPIRREGRPETGFVADKIAGRDDIPRAVGEAITLLLEALQEYRAPNDKSRSGASEESQLDSTKSRTTT